jgi:hypothetical protein
MNVIVYRATTDSFLIRYPSGAEELFVFDGKDWGRDFLNCRGLTYPTKEEIAAIETLSEADISNIHQVSLILARQGQKETQISLRPLKTQKD